MFVPTTTSSRATGRKESTMDFSTIQHGLLPAGTVTPQGVIARSSMTAYQMEDGAWVPFAKVHGPRPWASPLVALG
jgi:hypothetical protein